MLPAPPVELSDKIFQEIFLGSFPQLLITGSLIPTSEYAFSSAIRFAWESLWRVL